MPKSKNRRSKKGGKSAQAKTVAATAAADSSGASMTPKVGPVKYVGQVRQEARKVVWPSWVEVWKTTILVMLMVLIMGLFFFVVDWALANSVQFILGLGN